MTTITMTMAVMLRIMTMTIKMTIMTKINTHV